VLRECKYSCPKTCPGTSNPHLKAAGVNLLKAAAVEAGVSPHPNKHLSRVAAAGPNLRPNKALNKAAAAAADLLKEAVEAGVNPP